jgi:hypothetical protein
LTDDGNVHDPADLGPDGKFSADRFCARMRTKHHYGTSWPHPRPVADPGRVELRRAAAAAGDRLRAIGKAAPLCWLPNEPT